MKTLLVIVGLCMGGNVWATDVPYNVGSSASDTWGKGFSDVWTLTGDGAVTVTFTNHCATTGNNWENWYLLCGNESYTPAAHEDANRYFQMRSDRWEDAAGSAAGFIVSDDYFTDFKTFQNEATVTMKIVRSGTTVTVNTSVTKSATTRTMTYVKTGLSGTLNFFLTQNLSYMQITQQTQTTDMTGTVTCNALVNFDNFTSEKTADTEDAAPASATGGKGTMSTSNAFQYKVDAGSYRLGLRNGANTIAINSSEYAGSKDIITISFDMALSQMNASGKKSYFYLQDASNADIARVTMEATNNSYTAENHYLSSYVDNTLGLENGDIDYAWSSENWGKKVHFTITLNYLTGKITTTTACATANNTTSSHTVDMTNTNPVAKFVVGAEYNCNYRKYRCQFDNLLIQTEKGDYNTTANITLTFKDNENNDISALYTGTTAFTPDKSTTFTPSNYYPAVMYDEDNKYTYTSGGDAFTVKTDETVTLVYTKSARPTYTYNVTANYGAKNKKIVDAVSVKEAADYTYYYPRFILDGTTLYEYASSTDANASASYWTSTHTNVSANATYTLTYNAIEGECVYYSEGEDIAGKSNAYTASHDYSSNGSSAVFPSEGATVISLDAGIYRVTMRAVGRATGGGTIRELYLFKESKEGDNIITVGSAPTGAESSKDFSLAATTDIVATGGYWTTSTNGYGMDYVYIMKLPASESVTVTGAGFATYVSAYDLDFSATSIKAYKVKVSTKGEATLSKVDNVPAGTPVLLYKAGGATEDIPVMTGAAAVTENDLVAGTGAAVATTDGDYTNMILNNVDEKIGFYFANDRTVATNRAYLHIATSMAPNAAEARMVMVFDDETTGIQATQNVKTMNDKYVFNLNGQRISKPQKGLYIQDGKKFMVK